VKKVRKTIGAFVAVVLMAAALVLSAGVAPAEASSSCEADGGTLIHWFPGNCKRICTSKKQSNINAAKISYSLRCGQTWQYNSGHHFCAWNGGWTCWGTR